MEDAHVANANYDDNPEKALFGVFDGHGGREVAVYCN
jgi:serine/threonine protein phosphatase PrpC